MARNSKGASDAPDTNTDAGTDPANPGGEAPGTAGTGTADAAGTKPPATDGAESVPSPDPAGATGEGQGGTAAAGAAAEVITVKLNVDTSAAAAALAELASAAADAKEAAAEDFPAARQTLREAVSSAAADAAKAGEHATHGVLNAIEVKLAELRNTIAASQSQVAEEYRHVLDWFENLL